MRTPRSWAGLAVVCAAAAGAGVFVACSDFTPPGPAGASALSVNPKTAHLNVGGTLQLSASGSSGALVWSSSNAAVATVDFGRVTAVGSGSATIRAVSGTNQATARITVTRAAAISLSSTNVGFSGVPAAPLPDSQMVSITNSGEDPLTGLQIADVTYGAGANGWLTTRLTQSDAPASLVLRPNTTVLAPGSYTATVSIGASSVSAPPQVVTVTYTIVHPAVITFGSSGATFTAQQGAALPSQQSIEITNSGDAPLTGLSVGQIAYSAGAPSWLDASVNPTTAPALLVLHPNTTALAPGSYSATVTIVSTAPSVAPASITISYNITPAPLPPTIEVSPTSLSFVAGRNFSTNPAVRQVAVSSGGTGTVSGLSASVSYGAGATGWLTTGFVGSVTTAPTTLNVQPNTTGLAAGVYSATIHLASTTSGVAGKDIPVTYVVNDLVLDQTSIQFYTKSSTVPSAQVVSVSNAGSGSISGVTATVALSGRADATYIWLEASVGSTVPQSPSTTPLTLTIPRADSLGTFTAVVTVSAPGMVSKTVNVTFLRQATMAGDIWPILHDSAFGTSTSKCSGCHSALTAADSSIDFSTSDQAFGSLVSPTFNGKVYFDTQADSTANFLYRIITGTAATSGAPNMPTSCSNGSASCMHPGLRTRIYIWILQGALKQ